MQKRRISELSRLVAALLVFAAGAHVLAQPGFQPGLGAPAAGGTVVPATPITGPIMADVVLGAGQQQQQAPLFPGQPAQPAVQVGAGSSPHPTTYTWAGERQDVTDPGPYFYHFYYTGTVQPDARILPDDAIQRIPIRQNEWVNYRRYIIAKLTNFYQVTNGLQPTAFADYQREMSGEAEPAASAIAPPQPVQPTPPIGFQPTFPGGDLVPPPTQFGGFNQFAAPVFDARAAAEWTFYYDQLVLWQYYCTRTLLNEEDDELIDEPRSTVGATAPGVAPVPFPAGGGFPVDAGDDLVSDGGGGQGFTPAFTAAPQQIVVREVFNAIEEYQDPNTNTKYRDKFIDRAQEHEQTVYQAYLDMINRIDQEALNQEKYEQWIAQRQNQILEFADNWRRLREGETLILDNTLFLITPERLEAPPVDAINLDKTEKLTPQDLLNKDGTVKKPEVR